MGYAAWTSNDNPELSFTDNQWTEPLILRFNNKEVRVFIVVDSDNQTYYADIKAPTRFDAPDFTEVEIALPTPLTVNEGVARLMSDGKYHYVSGDQLLLDKLEKYYSRYKIMKMGTDFSFSRRGVEQQ